MKQTLLILCGVFCTFFVLMTNSLIAQSSITVYVYELNTTDPVSAHSLVLEHLPTGLQYDGITDSRGTITFKNLNARTDYRIISIESPAYRSDTLSSISLRSKENKYLDFGIARRQSVDLEEVTISARPSQQINRSNAEVAFELDEKSIQAIPVEGRDITRVLYRLPNVAQATGFYPEAPNVSINGANPLYSSYLIDGMDNNERFLGGQKFAIPTGFTQNITLLTNNYSAEYGLAGNGVLDITTKSGSNEFSGEAFTIT
ncbi:MAG: TonB-dependent receptor plug domain-containing protein, partial [Bacteroidetes bacterium]|nr:TonB-dependent receptor plug domain-containing protein [Bacteroidota bacterium]